MLLLPEWSFRYKGEVISRESLPALIPAWKDLCRRSVEDNVYYSPKYALALLNHVESQPNLKFAVVWDGVDLVAFLPITKHRLRVPLLQPAGQAWKSKYTFSCMPLLDRQRSKEAAAALVDVLANEHDGEWLIPTINTHGEACQAIIAALESRGAPWLFANRFQRAQLETGTTFDAHMTRLAAKRRRELARNRRRLEQLGVVRHQSYRSGDGLSRAVSAFLTLEMAGWKGKSRTALGCDEATRSFAIDAFTGDEDSSICRADVLTLNEAPIAVSLATFAGRTGFTVKCAYDEAYRSYSAGLLLEVEVIRSFLSDNWAARLDAGTDGIHVVDDLWLAGIEVADLMFSLAPNYPERRLSALASIRRRQQHIKTTLKTGLKPKRSA